MQTCVPGNQQPDHTTAPIERHASQRRGKMVVTPHPPALPVLSLPKIVGVILPCTLVFLLGVALLVLWVLRRRAARRRAILNGDTVTSSEDGGRSSEEAMAGRRRLQKVCSVPSWPARRPRPDDDVDAVATVAFRHRSLPVMPRAFAGRFGRSQSCKLPAAPTPAGTPETKGGRPMRPSWIDEDALPGPKVSGFQPSPPAGKKRTRVSWPMRNTVPTLPRLHHTIHGYPVAGRRDEEASLRGGVQTGPDYGQLRASARALPEPPKPALVANKDRHVAWASDSMGHVRGKDNPRAVPRPLANRAGSPVGAVPMTPSRHRAKHQSADPILTEILRSTEERLREGSVFGTVRSNRPTGSLTKMLAPQDRGTVVSPSMTPSPKKPGHKLQGVEQSVPVGADSTVGDRGVIPGGLSRVASQSRSQRKQDPGKQPRQAQSVRSSVSSELSTLYSEDEMPEEVRRAIMPFAGFVVQPQHVANVAAATPNDPFVSSSLPSASETSRIHGWPARQHKAQDLFRESLERSRYLRRLTLGQPPFQPSQGLVLAPRPLTCVEKPSSSLSASPGSSRRSSVKVPSATQPYVGHHALPASRGSGPQPPPTRQLLSAMNPNGPLFLRLTKTSTLSTVPSLPPPSASEYFAALRRQRRKTMSPTKPVPTPQDRVRRPTTLLVSPTERERLSGSDRQVGGESRRVSIVLPAEQQQQQEKQQQPQQQQKEQNRQSTSSSIYSQDLNPGSSPATPTKTATSKQGAGLNHVSFHANQQLPSLYPAPLTLSRRNSRANSPSKLSLMSLGTDITVTTHSNNSGSNGSSKGSSNGTSDTSTVTNNTAVVEQEGDAKTDTTSHDDDGEGREREREREKGSKDHHDNDDDVAPLLAPALTSTIASLRRMNSSLSASSSLLTMSDRNPTPTPTPAATPIPAGRPTTPEDWQRTGPAAAVAGVVGTGGGGDGVNINASPGRGGAGKTQTSPGGGGGGGGKRRSTVGARNYFILGGGGEFAGGGDGSPGGHQRQQQQGRYSKRVSWADSSGNGGSNNGNNGSAGLESPTRRRRAAGTHAYPRHRRTGSTVLRMSSPAGLDCAAVWEGEGKENKNDDDDSKGPVGGFKTGGGEFTFEAGANNGNKKSGLGSGLREGSGGNVQPQQQQQPQQTGTTWKTADRSGSGDSPSRRSVNSVDSLGLYDRQGFLIASSPVRVGSPGLRV